MHYVNNGPVASLIWCMNCNRKAQFKKRI